MNKKIKIILLLLFIILGSAFPILLSYTHKENEKLIGQPINVEQIEYDSLPTVTVEDEIKEVKKLVESMQPKNIGKFKLTAYCSCKICCGKWSGGNTASGTKPTANRTIAVDTSVIPFGTKVIIDGRTYIAEDTGSAIKGNKIDIYFDNHEEALKFGVKYIDVKIVK